MQNTILLGVFYCLFQVTLSGQSQQNSPGNSKLNTSKEVLNLIPDNVLPSIGAWFWGRNVLDPEGYKTQIDNFQKNSPFNLLSVGLRIRGYEITHIDVHNQVKKAVEYAKERGIRLAVELDPRVARRSFELKYPDELQDMLRLREVDLKTNDTVIVVLKSIVLTDHMTGGSSLPYIPLKSALLRVYSYDKSAEGIYFETISDITNECEVIYASKDSIAVRVPYSSKLSRSKACIMVSFTHLTPDVFAPHLIEFQRDLLRMYSDVPMGGVMKDEWGFPPTREPFGSNFWYTKYLAEAYAENTEGRELLADYLMMAVGIKGKEEERQFAINHLMELNWKRNGAIEDDFYKAVKQYFGKDAAVVTHPTWYSYPCTREYRKNGMDWWVATRDWAQTDEDTPFGARTSLAKKWGSAVCYNQFYATQRKNYQHELWSSALAGCRINYHPLYGSTPIPVTVNRYTELMRGGLMSGESRVHLLNYISKTPLDCPVAVIFGHACTMNWAGPYYDDIGMELVNNLWCQGVPADIIPSSEITNGSFHLDDEGYICYGPQRYYAVVLYHPEFENQSTADFFNKAANGKTRMIRVGNWQKDFNVKPFDGKAALPKSMVAIDNTPAVLSEVNKIIKKQKIAYRTPSKCIVRNGNMNISHPTTGFCRLVDGTLIQAAGTDNAGGDPIISTMKVQGFNVSFDAVGVAAVRLNNKGEVQAMVAGGLKSFRTEKIVIDLDERIDMALWINDKGEWEGVLQGWIGDIPPRLLSITGNWLRLNAPVPLPE